MPLFGGLIGGLNAVRLIRARSKHAWQPHGEAAMRAYMVAA